MKNAYRRALIGVAVVALGTATAVLYYGFQLASIGTAYTAKILCSGIFVSHRDPQSLLGTDLAADDLSILRHIDARIGRDSREVMATLFGFAKRKAVYREGRGCSLVYGEAPRPPPRENGSPIRVRELDAATDDLKLVKSPPPGIDRRRLETALQWAFSEPELALPRRTRAVVVVHENRLVAEHYAPGFTKDTPLLGWSMTKTVINALVGVLVKEGKISLGDAVPMPNWQEPGDPRRKITWDHLLRMTSGLQFDEDQSNPRADVTYMLLGAQDMAAYAAAKPLEAEPGARWSYSSGTTNIIAYAIRQVVGDSNYWGFPRRALFNRLGMTSAVMETDATGTFVGSSFMYATARDWARLGLLYLNDGIWAGQRVLPEGWVAYSRSPTPNSLDQQHGAHVWLQIPNEYRCASIDASLPADAFHAIGHEGQFVTIIPSRELVLVRLGFTRYPCAWDQQRFVHLVLEAIVGGERANTSLQGAHQRAARP